MGPIIIIALALVSAVGFAVAIFTTAAKKSSGARKAVKALEEDLAKRESLKSEIESAYSQLVEIPTLQKLVEQVQGVNEALKAERGRIMITQAELETVESRLRELEEIEREFEASGLETKQELTILQKKQEELSGKNGQLKQQISQNDSEINKLMGEIEMSAQAQEQVRRMQSELVRTQAKIDQLLGQLETGNDQYFNAKRRYDALDIEYAQLYEKFSETEAKGDEEE